MLVQRRFGLPILVFALVAVAIAALAALPGHDAAHAARPSRLAMQGVQASGFVTLGGGTCFPDALLVDCDGNVTRQLKGPGGAGFFTPYIGKWVDLTGAEQTCPAGDKYLDVVTIQVSTAPCGTPTATPLTPTATPAGPTPVPTAVVPTPTPPGGGNLALGKAVFASSTQPGMPPEQAVDGNPASVWGSQPGYDPWAPARNVQWIYVDLGNTYTVKTMHMTWGHWRHARSYAIYAWADWCNGWCIFASTTSGDGDDTAVFPEPIEARYFMLWLVNPYMIGRAYELAEWDIGGSDVVPPSSLKNVAAGKPAVSLNHTPGFEAPRSTDADLNTDWQSLNLPSWIYVDFQGTFNVDRAILRWSPGVHATSYALYAWNGWAWVPVYSTNRGAGGDETVIFPPVRTRWMLLYATAGPAGKAGLRELEIYERAAGSGRPLGTTPGGTFRLNVPLEVDPSGVVPEPGGPASD